MEDKKVLSSKEEIKALSDPYKIEILTTFGFFGGPATVKQIADKMKETPAKVHYHVKKLEALDILKLVKTETINGIIAKYYEPTAKQFKVDSKKHQTDLVQHNLSETEKMISSIYDLSKKTFLSNWENAYEGDQKIGRAMSYLVSLTDRQLNQVIEYMELITEASKEESPLPSDARKYHMFFSLIPVEKKKKD